MPGFSNSGSNSFPVKKAIIISKKTALNIKVWMSFKNKFGNIYFIRLLVKLTTIIDVLKNGYIRIALYFFG